MILGDLGDTNGWASNAPTKREVGGPESEMELEAGVGVTPLLT